MKVDKKSIYVGAEQNDSVYSNGFVFPGFDKIDIEVEVSGDITHIFPKFDDARDGVEVTKPLILLDTDVVKAPTKFQDDLEEHTFPKPDLFPPMLCKKGFDDNDFVFKVVDVMDRMMGMDAFDIIDLDISQESCVKHYDSVLRDKESYVPYPRPGTELNKSLNDFIVKNMAGTPVEAVCDLGSGKGASVSRLQRLGRVKEGTMIDCVEPVASLCEVIVQTPIPEGAVLNVHNTTASEFLSGVREKYDLIVANNSLHLAYNHDPGVLDKIHAALKDHGEFVGVFPNYDSLVMRPSYGCVAAGLVRSYVKDGRLWMLTDVSGVRRHEPVFPFWALLSDKWDVTFDIGSNADSAQRGEVVQCYTTFKARKRKRPKAFKVMEVSRSMSKGSFVRPEFHARKQGRKVALIPANSGHDVAYYCNRGKALTWSDFFCLRSMTFLATSKVNGYPGCLYSFSGRYYVVVNDKVYLISGEKSDRDDMRLLVEVIFEGTNHARLVLSEDHRSSLLVNMFNEDYPSFVFLKDYLSVVNAPGITSALVNESEGLILQGAFARTAWDGDKDFATYIKWDPTIDLRDSDGVVREYHLDGTVNRERPDKRVGNNLSSIVSIIANMTPSSFVAAISLPIDLTDTDMPRKELMSYPFGSSDFITRNSYVGSYNKGVFPNFSFSFPQELLQGVANRWDVNLFERIRGMTN